MLALVNPLLCFKTLEDVPITEKNHHQLLASQWMGQFGHDYIAHAVWNGNFAGVVKRKQVLPAEAILREGSPVEYESGGAFGQRSVVQLVSFPEETFEEIDQLFLTPKQKNSLTELEKFFQTKNFSGGEKYLEKLLDNELFLRKLSAYDLSEEEEKQIKNINEFFDKFLENKFLWVKEGFLDARNHRNEKYAREYWNEAKKFIETENRILTFEEEAFFNRCTEQKEPKSSAIPVENDPKLLISNNQIEKSLQNQLLQGLENQVDTTSWGIAANSLTVEERFELQNLMYKLVFRLDYLRFKRSQLKYYQRCQEGITFNKPNKYYPCRCSSIDNIKFKDAELPRVFYWFNENSDITIKQFVNYQFKFIVHDLHKNNAIDTYLSRKYTKWMKKRPEDKTIFINTLYLTRKHRLLFDKMNPEIRAERNSIRWSYGDIAILRGNPSSIIAGDCKFRQDVKSGEVLLLSPFMNNGKFFSLPLVQEETFILGKQASLQPFAEELDQMGAKYAYLENLTVEQQLFFNLKNL